MKILIEASEAYRNQTGIGRFSRELIRHLPPSLDIAYSPPDYAARQHTPGRRTALKRITHFADHVRLTQLLPLSRARVEQATLVHSLSFFTPLLMRNIPKVITVFDLAYFDLPQETDRFWGAYGRKGMPIFARNADAIITTSDVMRARIAEQFGVPLERIHRVYGGVSRQFRPLDDLDTLTRIREQYRVNQPYVFYVGAWSGNKNLPLLLRAFAPIREAELILTGQAHSPQQQHIPELARELNVNARFIGYVPDEDLSALYRLAEVVVLPSLYEGFGLPVLEAMACGAPVVISDIPVLVEIAGDAAPCFPAQSAEALHDLLVRLLQSPDERASWQAKSLERAAQFTWEATAQQVIQVWQSLHR